MKDIIAKYRGNYIAEMRKIVGHAPLRIIGCGVIIENDKGEILLQKRRDNGLWAIIGGSMESGKKFIETVKREAFEAVINEAESDGSIMLVDLNEIMNF